MSGNVAEMVTVHEKNNAPGTKGGGWLNKLDAIKQARFAELQV